MSRPVPAGNPRRSSLAVPILDRLKQLLHRDRLHNLTLRRHPGTPFAAQVEAIRVHLRRRGKRLRPDRDRPRVFLAVRPGGWESAGLIDTWAQVADVVAMDYDPAWDPYARDWMTSGRVAFRRQLLDQVTAAHQRAPIDLFFGYLSGGWTDPQAIESINQLGPITANISFDDSHRFWGKPRGGGWTGSATLAPAFDLSITLQDPRDVAKYHQVGARPLYLLPGGNESVFAHREPAEQRDIPVTFVGQDYGRRRRIVQALRDAGIEVVARGLGWEQGPIDQAGMLDLFHRSLLVLGVGYVGKKRRTALKGRDFEIPMTGAAYLTTHNDHLAECFEPGREILLYRNPRELIQIARSMIADPKRAVAVGQAGRRRALADHRWSQRWREVLEILRQPDSEPGADID